MQKDNEEHLQPEGEEIEHREHVWWVTAPYMTGVCHIIAEQYVARVDYHPTSFKEFREDVTFVLRQHCPVAYEYIFSKRQMLHIPSGSMNIIISLIREQRPLFGTGVIGIGLN